MSYRGRLIWPMFIEVERIDTDATRTTDPDAGGSLTSGYDDVFEEPVLVPAAEVAGAPPTGSPRGTVTTVYQTAIRLEAQIEVDDFNVLRQFASGDTPGFELRCVMHYAELERLGLIGLDGSTLLRKGDRLRRIISQDATTVLFEVPYPPGLYLMHPQDRSFGLSGGTRNLFVAHFQDRAEGVPA
jgi:hypothetical protein